MEEEIPLYGTVLRVIDTTYKYVHLPVVLHSFLMTDKFLLFGCTVILFLNHKLLITKEYWIMFTTSETIITHK